MFKKDIEKVLNEALAVIRDGGVILYPTDTVWGLGCDATNPEAVARIYGIKHRDDSKSLVLLACDLDDEACAALAAQPENPDVMLRLLELLNTWRESAELLSGAPYGSLLLFDAGRMVAAWQAALENLTQLEDRT